MLISKMEIINGVSWGSVKINEIIFVKELGKVQSTT